MLFAQRNLSIGVSVLTTLIVTSTAQTFDHFTLKAYSSNKTDLDGAVVNAKSGHFWVGIGPRYGCSSGTCDNATIFNNPSGSLGAYTPDNMTLYTTSSPQYVFVSRDGSLAYEFSGGSGSQEGVGDASRGFQNYASTLGTDYLPTLVYNPVYHGGFRSFYACPGPFYYNEINENPGIPGVNSASYQIHVDTGSLWSQSPAALGCFEISIIREQYNGTSPVDVYS